VIANERGEVVGSSARAEDEEGGTVVRLSGDVDRMIRARGRRAFFHRAGADGAWMIRVRGEGFASLRWRRMTSRG
jgi:hypothetical protein